MTVDLLVTSMISDPPATATLAKQTLVMLLDPQALHVQVSTSMFCASLAMYNFAKQYFPMNDYPDPVNVILSP